MNSRQKGKRGELDHAHRLKNYGYEARRGQQYCGANGDADVVGLPGVHIEVKRTERFKLYDAMEQAERDAKAGETPVVVTRRNNKNWLVCMKLEDFMEMYEGGKTNGKR